MWLSHGDNYGMQEQQVQQQNQEQKEDESGDQALTKDH